MLFFCLFFAEQYSILEQKRFTQKLCLTCKTSHQKNRCVSIRIIHWDYTAPAIDAPEKAPSNH